MKEPTLAQRPKLPMSFAVKLGEKVETSWIPAQGLLIASVVDPIGLGVDAAIFISHNGESGKPMADLQQFDILGLLAESLSVSENLDPARKEFAGMVAKAWRKSKGG